MKKSMRSIMAALITVAIFALIFVPLVYLADHVDLPDWVKSESMIKVVFLTLLVLIYSKVSEFFGGKDEE